MATRERQRGQALYETAVTLPLFLFALFGIIFAANAGALSERVQLGVRYAGVLSAQSNPYLDYSLYALYNNLGTTSFAPTQACFAPPAQALTGGSLTTIPNAAGSSDPANAFARFWQPLAVTPGCDGGPQFIARGNDLSRDYLLLRNGATLSATPNVPSYLAGLLGGSRTSARGTFYRSPNLATLLACDSDVRNVLTASLRPGSDTSSPAVPPQPLDATLASQQLALAASCDSTTGATPPPASPTPTAPPTAAPPTATPSPIPTPSASPSPTPKPTSTPTPKPTSTPTPKPTATPTPKPTSTPTPKPTATPTPKPTSTPTPKPTSTPTPKPTSTPTPKPTSTPTPTPTATPTATPTPTPTAQGTPPSGSTS
jgi:hypothetical protein